MSTFTENYNLIKPDQEDYYDIQNFNENMDAIDLQMALTEQEIAGVSEKIGTSEDEITNTVFGKLNGIEAAVSQGTSPIKSIQRVIYLSKSNDTTLEIKTVDPNKCIVLMDELYSSSGTRPYTGYTLNANSLVISHDVSVGSYDIRMGYWIIEFY